MSFPRYPAYRDSGVPWLGQVPSHWSFAPLKRHFEVTLGKMVTKEGEQDDRAIFPYLRSANVQAGRVSLDDVKRMWLAPEEREQLELRAGDLLVCEGGDVGRCTLLDQDLPGFGFQNSVLRIRPLGHADNRILAYWLSLLKDNGFIDVLCNKATIAHFTTDKVRNLPVAVPPLPEQRLIAGFIDRETAMLDALAAEQETLLARLEEKRTATIAYAVTKGLDPTVPMKDSGIEWLGQVPAHWVVARLGRLVKGRSGTGGKDEEGLFPLYGANGIIGTTASCPLPVGTIIIGRVGSAGSVNVMDKAGDASDNAIIIASDCNNDWLAYLLQSFDYSLMITGSANPLLVSSRLMRRAVAFPHSLDEQRALADFLSLMDREIRTLADEARASITLLHERRAALISAAVMGRIDVREAAMLSRDVARAA